MTSFTNAAPLRRALLSVYDKSGLEELAGALKAFGVELIASDGTAELLHGCGIEVEEVSSITGDGSLFGGRVKTLHPKIFGGILARRESPEDQHELEAHHIETIDLVALNFYPFEEQLSHDGTDEQELLEQIDIGGPSLLRAAAKNYRHVVPLCRPVQYRPFIEELRGGAGEISLAFRRRLASEAFSYTAGYEQLIAEYFRRGAAPERFPESLELSLRKTRELRYGENPHQSATLYRWEGAGEPFAKVLQGKPLSYNNILDLAAARRLLMEFDSACAVIIKHLNPCGCAIGATPEEAFRKARATDRTSAFGGIIGFNRPVNAETATEISEHFVECLIAPAFEPASREILARRKNLRLVEFDGDGGNSTDRLELRSIQGGLLVQDRDPGRAEIDVAEVVTRRSPTDQEWNALEFAWKVVKHVRSNAIVFANTAQTLGIGAGQMSRVDSCRIATEKAADAGISLQGAVVASDAFFAFRDALDVAAEAGAVAAVQPGGSIRDGEVIGAADERDMAMVFTHRRYFRH